MRSTPLLPPDIRVFERGWLSSNNILIVGAQGASLIDSGYCTHAGQTVALVERALGDRPLDVLINTHLHSDHCGGNAALQSRYPDIHTRIPPGHSQHVLDWDPSALSFSPTGQQCPAFVFNSLLLPGSEIKLGERTWQIHAAAGHDPHSVVLFEPELGLLISADALWENGFGVVFPELEGQSGFEEVSRTLDLIASLHPRLVIPGHGRCFVDVETSLGAARRRLDYFIRDPVKHATYAAKVLLKFKLLELQRIDIPELMTWSQNTPYLSALHQLHWPDMEHNLWVTSLIQELIHSGAAVREGNTLINL